VKLWIVVNAFLRTEKFVLLENRLKKTADRFNIDYEIVTNADCMPELNTTCAYTGIIPANNDPILFWDKDILLAKTLEASGHRLYNCSDAIAICDDKRLTAVSLINSNITIPKTIIAPMTYNTIGFTDYGFLTTTAQTLGFPLIVKEAFSSFGAGVYLCNNMEELINTVTNQCSPNILFQEYIDTSYGKDIRLQVVGNEVISSIFRYSENGDYRANLTNGGSMKPYNPSDDEIKLALDACKLLKLDFAGVDILFGENGPILCEINSNAHFINLDYETGSDTAEAIIKYILSNYINN